MPAPHQPPARRSGRLSFGLVSVLALLALACFPVFAYADVDFEYKNAAPTIDVPDDGKDRSGPKADISDRGNGDSDGGDTGSPGDGSSEKGSSGKDDNPSTTDGGGTAPGGKGNGSTGSGPGGSDASGSIDDGTPVSSEVASDEGSSPLVPILIAIAVLAAISIGTVAMRQRRRPQDGAPASSPEPS